MSIGVKSQQMTKIGLNDKAPCYGGMDLDGLLSDIAGLQPDTKKDYFGVAD